MPVDSPEAHRPTELASAVATARGRPGATARGKPGATPKGERPPTREPAAGGAGEPPSDAGSIPLGEVIGERYKLVAHIGSGGQGEVWRAEDVEIAGHTVALKMLFERAATDADRDMQLRELRMLATVSHPAVVQFKDHGWLGGRLWFVMPWYEGQDLERAIPLDRLEARRVFETVAGGLAAVHAKGLRHQDIKPGNIFLAKIDGLEGTMPILLDFGVAAVEGETLVAGSPAYFAPELAAGWPGPSIEVGPAADVFALALALRNALDPAGVPEVGAFDRESLDRRAKELIPPPRGAGLDYLAPSFARWLAIDPAKRPTAAELVHELAILTAPEEHAKERRRTLRRIAPWAGLGLVLASLGGWWGWTQVVAARKAQASEASERAEAERLAQSEAERAEELGSQLGDALVRADTASQRTTDALGRLDAAEAAIASAQGNAEQLRVARDGLRRALAEARTEVQAHQAALGDAQGAMTRLGSDLADARRRLDETRAQLETTRAEREALASERQGLQAQLEALRSQSERQQSELEALQSAQQRLSSAQQALESERDGLRATVEQERAAHAAAEARASAAESELASARAERDRLRAAGTSRPVVTPAGTPSGAIGPAVVSPSATAPAVPPGAITQPTVTPSPAPSQETQPAVTPSAGAAVEPRRGRGRVGSSSVSSSPTVTPSEPP